MGKKAKILSKFYSFQILIALFGAGLSLYQLNQHTRLKSGIQDTGSICAINSFLNCDVVEASQYATLFGIPLAAIGAVFFMCLFLLSAMVSPDDRRFPQIQRLAARLSLLGIVFDVYLLGVQLLILNALCLLCLTGYVANVFYFITCKWTTEAKGKGPRAFFASLKGKILPLNLPGTTWLLSLTAFISFVGFVFVFPSAIWLKSNLYSYGERLTEQFYSKWVETTGTSVPINPDDASMGNPNARIKIVEFSDFECPHCKKAAFTLHTALKSMGSKVHFVFKHYPLDSTCNPQLKFQMHPKACRLAKLAVCANQKNKFWKFHDQVFFKMSGEEGLPDWDGITERLSSIFSETEIRKCLADPKVARTVREDIALAKKLGIKGTPSVFINGKRIEIPITVDTLNHLIALEAR